MYFGKSKGQNEIMFDLAVSP